MAMTARKLLGAEGSGRLAMRRESLSSRRPTKPARSTTAAEGFTSPTAAYIANPHSFRPVHLYAPQYALHASFTPAHMPLPVHLGIQTYYKADSRMEGGEMFGERDEGARRKAIGNLQKVAGNKEGGFRKRMTNLREHLATVANFSTHPQLASLLTTPLPPPTTTHEHEPTAVFDGFTLGEFHNSAFGPTTDSNTSRTFDEMVHSRLGGQSVAGEGTPMQEADRAWEAVLGKMDAAVEPVKTQKPAEPTLSISDAVSEVESLLASLGLAKRTAKSFIRRSSTRRGGRIEQMALRPMRVTSIGADVSLDQVAWMDSVKRKRQKKISKHK